MQDGSKEPYSAFQYLVHIAGMLGKYVVCCTGVLIHPYVSCAYLERSTINSAMEDQEISFKTDKHSLWCMLIFLDYKYHPGMNLMNSMLHCFLCLNHSTDSGNASESGSGDASGGKFGSRGI